MVGLDILTFVSIGLVLGLIVLLALQVTTSMRVQRLTYPLYEYAQAKAQAEVDRILNEAREQAHGIIAKAESEAAQLVETQRAEIDARARDYQKALQAFDERAQKALGENVEKTRAERDALALALTKDVAAQGESVKASVGELGKTIRALFESASAQAQEVRRALEAQSREASGDLARAFEEIAKDGKKRIDEQIAEFSKQAEAEVAAYRDSRKRIVDAHMADLVVESTRLVLQKTLTQEEHAQLVQRALKEAHAAGIF